MSIDNRKTNYPFISIESDRHRLLSNKSLLYYMTLITDPRGFCTVIRYKTSNNPVLFRDFVKCIYYCSRNFPQYPIVLNTPHFIAHIEIDKRIKEAMLGR